MAACVCAFCWAEISLDWVREGPEGMVGVLFWSMDFPGIASSLGGWCRMGSRGSRGLSNPEKIKNKNSIKQLSK